MLESSWSAITPAITLIVPATCGVTFTVTVPLIQGQITVVPGLTRSWFTPQVEPFTCAPSEKTTVTFTFVAGGEPELPTCTT